MVGRNAISSDCSLHHSMASKFGIQYNDNDKLLMLGCIIGVLQPNDSQLHSERTLRDYIS